MRTGFFKGVVLGAVVCGMTVVSTAALAGTGIGGVFNLGATNTVNAIHGAARFDERSTTSRRQQRRNRHRHDRDRHPYRSERTSARGRLQDEGEQPQRRPARRSNVDRVRRGRRTHRQRPPHRTDSGRQCNRARGADVRDGRGNLRADGLWNVRGGTGTNPSTALDVWVVHDGVTRFVTQATSNDRHPDRARRQGRRVVHRASGPARAHRDDHDIGALEPHRLHLSRPSGHAVEIRACLTPCWTRSSGQSCATS